VYKRSVRNLQPEALVPREDRCDPREIFLIEQLELERATTEGRQEPCGFRDDRPAGQQRSRDAFKLVDAPLVAFIRF
jgi:hypothetical protein